MKRTSVVLDEKLLEDARIATGEKTYSATSTKALEKVVKQQRFRRTLEEFEREAAKGGFFHPDYLAEKSANSMFDEPKRCLSAGREASPASEEEVTLRPTRS